jgi:proteic killer suppression protein
MIRSFKDADTETIFRHRHARRFPPDIHRSALRKLEYLNVARTLSDLREPPGNHLGKLAGERAGQHSIRINDQWRVCFEWREGDAYDVEITDYH